MSCIAGIVNLDGAPVDRALLERMTGTMKNRAPDAIGVWCSGPVGFGHAMLRASPESAHEHQPCTLDGQVWITADARIDGRDELIRRLRSAGREVAKGAPDPELILHAYGAFGEALLEHLIGDFAFALWDEHNKKLICARDQFGIRPFFYARSDRVLVFASDPDAILEHPATTRTLDDGFIADFLLFGFCMENGLSAYRDIKRLPAAHCLVLDSGQCRTRRYWDVPSIDAAQYARRADWPDQFRELFEQSVGDRIRANGIALELSGGLDSSSIAAVAAAQARTTGCALQALTISCRGLFPDDEEALLAEATASRLNIPISRQASEDYTLFDRFGTPELATPEPFANPDLAMHYDRLALIARSGARVLLTGQGGDAVFAGNSTYYADLLRHGNYWRFLAEAYRHTKVTGSIYGMGLRSALLGPSRQEPWQPPFPDWINPEFSKRVRLKDRFEAGWRSWGGGGGDLRHQMRQHWQTQTYEAYDALKMPLITRHPFYDVRLVTFMLGLPTNAVFDKKLLRDAMRGKLPERILARPKTALVGDHFRARFSTYRRQIVMKSGVRKVAPIYVEPEPYMEALDKYLGGSGADTNWSSWFMITPIALDFWLQVKE